MKPLQSIAMGLVVIVLTARFGGYDALADPLGWLLVLLGVHRLPADLDRREALLVLAAVAGLVAVPLWVPAVVESLYDADASLGWAANLPQLAFTGLLCHVLAGRAAAAGDLRPARWLRLAVTLTVVVALLPVLVLGAGIDGLAVTSYVLGAATVLLVVWVLFACSGRPWAGGPSASGRSGETPAGDRSGP